MSWDPFLIKFLLEKKIFGSCEQYMESTRKTEKPYKCASQKKKKKRTPKRKHCLYHQYPNGYYGSVWISLITEN